MAPYPTPIYHITAVDNLRSFMAQGGVCCVNELSRRGCSPVSIAYEHIQDRRATKMVSCCQGGTLHDYTPFYFAPRSPMLFTLSRGNVPGYAGGQEAIVHLVSTAQLVQAAGLPFAFTDGHGTMAVTQYSDDLADLEMVDWEIMKATYWRDTNEDPDRKRRRQAEFLVHRLLPWELITEIGVLTSRMKARVQEALQNAGHAPTVTVRPDWYY